MPGPRRELVARQAQPDHGVAGRGTHGAEHVAGEALPIVPPLVVALVGQPAEELADEAVLAGVDLDPVAPRRHGRGRRGGEPVDDGADVTRLHRLGDLAAC